MLNTFFFFSWLNVTHYYKGDDDSSVHDEHDRMNFLPYTISYICS